MISKTEHPILFNSEMVRAILEGRKTQTRRVINPQPVWIAEPNIPFKTIDANPQGIINCKYGQIGDRLWVKETYIVATQIEGSNVGKKEIWYKATPPGCIPVDSYKWKPSIFIPRRYSRILLEITDIWVERLQDISEEDCLCEGIRPIFDSEGNLWTNRKEGWEYKGISFHYYKEKYEELWDSINGKKYPWVSDPWVWVIEFKRIDNANRL